MASRRWSVAIASALVVVAIVLAYRWWASEARAIRHQLATIARLATPPPDEGDLGMVTRLAQLRNALAPDIRVSATAPGTGAQMPQEIVGRDVVLALAGRWQPTRERMTLEFVDVQVTVDDGGKEAEVYCTAKVTLHPPSEPPTVDARELTIGFAKVDGIWIVRSVRQEPTLIR